MSDIIEVAVAMVMAAPQRGGTGGDAPGPVGLVLEDGPAAEGGQGVMAWLIGPEGLGVTSPLVIALAGSIVAVVVGLAVWRIVPRLVRRGGLRAADPETRTLVILARAAGLGRGDLGLLRRLAAAHPATPSAGALLLSGSALREACTRLARSDPASAAPVARLRERVGV